MTKSRLSLSQQIVPYAARAHLYFAANIWPKCPLVIQVPVEGGDLSPAYHTDHHIWAVVRASELLLQAASVGNQDPTHIFSDLDRTRCNGDIKMIDDTYFRICQCAII